MTNWTPASKPSFPREQKMPLLEIYTIVRNGAGRGWKYLEKFSRPTKANAFKAHSLARDGSTKRRRSSNVA
ncbi:cytochrome oxidase subunit I [Anopheles sinensis]|uniref:Cytochrome oxidase subunit I n=1 Tax=Anopheles sinensis TaxID=74873 RepID=A0A084WU55_ANOSI|nr:cytochrome oxidase subunit I [Anopheles sinensis]